jgi:hypothetical protein
MQLIANGPDIPAAVLHSQEEERLVFFCGAGISMPSGLPNFRSLVEDVRDQLGAAFTPQEKREFDAEACDRVLGMFELNTRFAIKARQKVVKRLATVENPKLDVHNSLLTLARRSDGSRQLVTTNFDNLFRSRSQTVARRLRRNFQFPNLVKWDGLVHFRGRIVPTDSDGRKLVFTSADFGVAYLVLALRELAADAELVSDRGVALILGRVAGVNDDFHSRPSSKERSESVTVCSKTSRAVCLDAPLRK